MYIFTVLLEEGQYGHGPQGQLKSVSALAHIYLKNQNRGLSVWLVKGSWVQFFEIFFTIFDHFSQDTEIPKAFIGLI